MSDELQRPPDEEEKDTETVSEDAPEKEAETPVEDDALITAEELREIRDRAKTAWLHPLRRLANTLVDAADGFFDALEGNKRKKG